MDRAPAVGMKGFTNPGSKGSVPTSLVCDVPRGVWLLEKSCRLHHGTEVFGQALEVQHPPDQITLLSHPHEPSPAKAPQPMPILALPEQLFDELATALGQAIRQPVLSHADPRMSSAAAATLGGDVRHDVARQQRLEEGLMEEALVLRSLVMPSR
jgi:hypothetical protein